jgi:transposase
VISPTATHSATQDPAALLAQLAAEQQRIALLEQENRWLKRQLFGRSSERTATEERNPDQARLFDEAEALASHTAPEHVTIPAHQRKKRGRKKLDAALPRVEVVHDIPEEHKHCAADGAALIRIGEEVSEQLDYQPARMRVIRHIRPQYACPCCRQGVHIAPMPEQLLPKSLATPSLLAHIVTAKFVDHLPLYRQERQFERLGVTLGRATMAGWMIRLGQAVQPLINLLGEQMLAAPLIHCDETQLQVLRSEKVSTDHWMWVRCAGPPRRRMVLFDYDPSRGRGVPKRLLTDYHGILLTDGYEAYAATAKAQGLTHAGCWAHARRKFEEARKGQPDNTASHAKEALARIGALYAIERPLWDRHRPITPEQRLQVRAELSAPLIAQLHQWLITLAPQVLPQSPLGKAVHYTLGQWEKLTVFLTHGEVPLDNNRCENAIRPFVIGRKGWLFSDTVPGAQASANLFSLVETAKANGIEPHAYLARLFEQLPQAKTVEAFEALLPWNLIPAPAEQSHQPVARNDGED